MLNLHEYLNVAFQKAISVAFPEVSTNKYSLRFFLSQNTTNDICTPIARQLSSLLGLLTANSVAEKLVESIQWDDIYLSSVNTSTFINNGFINFDISHTYLQKILFRDFSKYQVLPSPAFKDTQFNSIYEKLKRLLLHMDLSGKYRDIPEPSYYGLLTNKDEHEILVLLTLSDFPELYSGKLFFIKRLMTLLEKYYGKTQLISKNEKLTTVRLLLIRRVVERVEMHLHL